MKTRNSSRGLAAFVVLALGLGLPVGAAPLGKGRWSQATTKSFVVTVDSGERDARRIARHLSTIHGVFQAAFPNLVQERGVRTPVLGVRGEKGLEPFMGERAKRVAGVLRNGSLRRDILIRTDLMGQQALTTVYHEYVHLVIHQNAPQIPAWLDEGLAEVWEDLDVSNPERIKVGRPSKVHLGLLRSKSLVPLADLLRADHLSELYRDPDLKSHFYAQSWALTHYLMMAEERKHAPSLERYVAMVGQGLDPLEAARRLFGDLEELEKKLWTYVRALTIPYLILSLPEVTEEAVEVRRLSEAESLAAFGDYLYFSNDREAARGMFERALAIEPALALAHQGLGLFDLYGDGDSEAAAARFERALEIDPDLWLSHYGLARASDDGESADEAEKHLRRAIELRPDASPALCRLGSLIGREAEWRRAGLEMVRRATAIDPEDFRFRLAELTLLDSPGDEQESAKELVDWLVVRARESENVSWNNSVCWYGALAGHASRVLPACDLACSLEPESPSSRDSRGLARALAGDVPGAIEDIRFALEAEEERSDDHRSYRAEWLQELEAGGEPFDDEAVERMRHRTPVC